MTHRAPDVSATRRLAATAAAGVMSVLWVSAPVLVPVHAAAQVAISPTIYTNQEAPNANGFPFSRVLFRQQQAHGDLRGQVLPISRMSFRRDQMFGGPSMSVTLEAFMGEGDIGRMTTSFAGNYGQIPTQVMLKGQLSLPAHPGLANQSPSPFDVVLPFRVNYIYRGTQDLLWELRIHGNSFNADTPYVLDAHSGGMLNSLGAQRVSGAGCRDPQGRNIGLVNRMETTSRDVTTQWDVTSAPVNSLCALFLGLGNPNLVMPGWCTNLYSDGRLAAFGRTDGQGKYQLKLNANHNNQGFGVAIHSQFWVVDPRIQPVGLHGSNGLESRVAPLALLRRLFAVGNPTAPTGTLNVPNDGVLVTQFR